MIYFFRLVTYNYVRFLLICSGMWNVAMVSPMFYQLTHPRRKGKAMYITEKIEQVGDVWFVTLYIDGKAHYTEWDKTEKEARIRAKIAAEKLQNPKKSE